MNNIAHLLESYGLGVALSMGMFTMMFFIVKWVLHTAGRQLDQFTTERLAWAKQLELINAQVDRNMSLNKSFHDQVCEAHRFQREEHKEMIACLGRINGYIPTVKQGGK